MQKNAEDIFTVKGIIPALALEEFDTDANLEELLPQEVMSLFKSVAPEFGTGELQYAFDDSVGTLHIMLKDIPAHFCVVNLSPHDGWGTDRPTDFFAIRAVFPMETMSDNCVMELNKMHSHVKFYSYNGSIVAEEAYYLTYGVPVLNVMDRIASYIKTVQSIVKS